MGLYLLHPSLHKQQKHKDMANENNEQAVLTPQQKIEESFKNVCAEFWKAVSASFATKQETGTDYATVATCIEAANELT
jgi:hypothetical protein